MADNTRKLRPLGKFEARMTDRQYQAWLDGISANSPVFNGASIIIVYGSCRNGLSFRRCVPHLVAKYGRGLMDKAKGIGIPAAAYAQIGHIHRISEDSMFRIVKALKSVPETWPCDQALWGIREAASEMALGVVRQKELERICANAFGERRRSSWGAYLLDAYAAGRLVPEEREAEGEEIIAESYRGKE